MRLSIRAPLTVLAIAVILHCAQGQPLQVREYQGEGDKSPNWMRQEPARTTTKTLKPHSNIYVIDTALVLGMSDDTLRNVYDYDANTKRILDLEEKLAGDEWLNSARTTNAYDDSGNMFSELEEHWWNGQWVPTGLATYTYDASGNRLSELQQDWENGQWVNGRRWTYTYDASGNRLLAVYEDWENGQWVYSSQWTATYDASDNRLSERESRWEDGQWVPTGLATYTYDESGNLLVEVSHYSLHGDWWAAHRSVYTYGPWGRLMSKLYQRPRGATAWMNQYRNAYTYDASGNLLLDRFQRYVAGVAEWGPHRRTTYSHDEIENLTSVLGEHWTGSSWIPTVIGERYGFSLIDHAGNQYHYHGWSLTFKYKAVVTEVVAESGEVPAEYALAQNYPNPFNPSTTIEYALPHTGFVTLKVYNVLGEEVAALIEGDHAAGTFKATWDVSGLPSGVYFYRLTAGEYVQTKKAVLMR